MFIIAVRCGNGCSGDRRRSGKGVRAVNGVGGGAAGDSPLKRGSVSKFSQRENLAPLLR
ncbi:MAG: hypothetical protein HDT47_04785 [Ruminococcaceae bacterium]|nr:hypothetical protein [Oscillospiraceae bacterium]